MTRLPKTHSRDAVDLKDMAMMFYGAPGIGKTTLASQFADGDRRPLFLWTSPVKFVDAYKLRMASWQEFTRAVRSLERSRPTRYSAIVVDTIDLLFTHCRKEVLDGRGIEHEADLDWGKGWDLVRSEWVRWMAKLVGLGYHVIFISHSQVREERGRVVATKKMVPTLRASAYEPLAAVCDVIGYLGFSSDDVERDHGARWVYFQPTDVIDAKDWTDKLPPKLRLRKDGSTAAAMKEALLGVAPATRPARRVRRKEA